MDELIISDKRFLSSRRAAKEHRYHSDYIGQLIRSGKVVGQKVGRAWYVEEESLKAYLSVGAHPAHTESATPQTSTAEDINIEEEKTKTALERQEASPTLGSTEPGATEQEQIKEKAEQPTVQIVEVPSVARAYHVPVRIQTPQSKLTYMPDDEPLLPEITRSKSIFSRESNVAELDQELSPRSKIVSRGRGAVIMLATGIVGILIGASASYATKTFVSTGQGGQTSSVIFSFER